MFLNCTPHPINIVAADGMPILTLPKGEIVPRLAQTTVTVDTINGVDITETQFGETEGLPEFTADVYLIVSRLVMSANPTRVDLLVPNGIVRDAAGNLIGATSFARN